MVEPVIEAGHYWLWESFCFLSQRRLVMQGNSQSIQMSEIESYHRYRALPEGWRKGVLLRVIDKLDMAYLAIMVKKKPPRDSGAEGGGGTRQMAKPGVK